MIPSVPNYYKKRITELETKLADITAQFEAAKAGCDAEAMAATQLREQLIASEARAKELETKVFLVNDAVIPLAEQLAAHQEALRVAEEALENLQDVKITEQPEWDCYETNGPMWRAFLLRYSKEALTKIEELTK